MVLGREDKFMKIEIDDVELAPNPINLACHSKRPGVQDHVWSCLAAHA